MLRKLANFLVGIAKVWLLGAVMGLVVGGLAGFLLFMALIHDLS